MPRRLMQIPAPSAGGSLSSAERAAMRRAFLEQVGPLESIQQLFNQLPGIYFSVKDRQSRLIWGNQALVQRLNVTENDIVGTTDDQYFPRHIAQGFVRDDQRVMRTGKPLINRIAMWYNDQGILDWFVKNKFPLRNIRGEIVGVVVSLQNYEGMRDAQTPFSELSRAVDYVRNHPRDRIGVETLAELCGVSSRQLHRKFRRAFGLSVQQFLVRSRIQGSIDLLIRTPLPIADIALESGFYDQSAFTRQFRQSTKLTPRRFRQLHAITAAVG